VSTVLRIDVTMTNEDDFDWLRNKIVAAVENEIDEQTPRLDGEVTSVDWDEVSA
jgi:Flp pilus assembly CpaF family ATPase